MAPGAMGCPCPCLTGMENSLRARGCRASAHPCPCRSERRAIPSCTLSHTTQTCPPKLAVSSTCAARQVPLKQAQPGRPLGLAAGPVLPSSHLLDHLGLKPPRVEIMPSPTIQASRSSLSLSSRSPMDSGPQQELSRKRSALPWPRKGQSWSLPKAPKRLGRFSSRRNRSMNCPPPSSSSTLHPPARASLHPPSRSSSLRPPARASASHPHAHISTLHPLVRASTLHPYSRTSSSHPDFREFYF